MRFDDEFAERGLEGIAEGLFDFLTDHGLDDHEDARKGIRQTLENVFTAGVKAGVASGRGTLTLTKETLRTFTAGDGPDEVGR